MPRDGNDERAERDLLELIRQREVAAEALKFATPDKVAEGQALLRMIDEKIERYERAIAPVQEAAAAHDKALDNRRQKAIEMLRVLDGLEKEPTTPKAALEMIPTTRAEALRFLNADAEERGIPNDDH